MWSQSRIANGWRCALMQCAIAHQHTCWRTLGAQSWHEAHSDGGYNPSAAVCWRSERRSCLQRHSHWQGTKSMCILTQLVLSRCGHHVGIFSSFGRSRAAECGCLMDNAMLWYAASQRWRTGGSLKQRDTALYSRGAWPRSWLDRRRRQVVPGRMMRWEIRRHMG